MQNIQTYPEPKFKGHTIRGLPITAPFIVKVDVPMAHIKYKGTFIILPFKSADPNIHVFDLTNRKQLQSMWVLHDTAKANVQGQGSTKNKMQTLYLPSDAEILKPVESTIIPSGFLMRSPSNITQEGTKKTQQLQLKIEDSLVRKENHVQISVNDSGQGTTDLHTPKTQSNREMMFPPPMQNSKHVQEYQRTIGSAQESQPSEFSHQQALPVIDNDAKIQNERKSVVYCLTRPTGLVKNLVNIQKDYSFKNSRQSGEEIGPENSSESPLVPIKMKQEQSGYSEYDSSSQDCTIEAVGNKIQQNSMPAIKSEKLVVTGNVSKNVKKDRIWDGNTLRNTKQVIVEQMYGDHSYRMKYNNKNTVQISGIDDDQKNVNSNKMSETSKDKVSSTSNFEKNMSEDGIIVKVGKRRRNIMQESDAELLDFRKKKFIKVDDDGETDTGKRRKSNRLRSLGFRPDYMDIESKLDRLLNSCDESICKDESNADIKGKSEETVAGNLDIDNNCESDEQLFSNHCQQKCNGNEEIDQSEIGYSTQTLKRKVKDKDPDFDPSEIERKIKKTKDKTSSENDEYDSEGSEDHTSEEGEEYESDDSDDLEIENSGRTLKKLVKETKKRITVKLEEHTDKFLKDVTKSFARKDRGKTEEENSNVVYLCIMCNRFQSQTVEGMELHLEGHLNGELNCKKCKFAAVTVSELKSHRLEKHGKLGVLCPDCGETFETSTHYKNHMGKHHNKALFQCVECEKAHGIATLHLTRKLLNEHENEKHKEIGFACEHCGRFIMKKHHRQIKLHKISCNGTSKSKICSRCGIQLSSQASLNTHVRRVHLLQRPFKCSECSFAAATSCKLIEHMRVHRGEHPFQCDQCSFSCVQKCQLKSHMRRHSGEKPYKCEKCKYAAAWKVQLKDHIQVHSMRTAFTCDQCDIVFKNEKALNVHKKKDHAS